MEIRLIEKEDLSALIEGENVSHYPYKDPDFLYVETVAPWAWTRQNFLQAMRQRRNARSGTYDTRTIVAVEEVEQEERVVGGLVVELQEEGYEILKLTAHPSFPEARTQLFKHLMRRAQNHQYRNKIVIHIPDGDWENVKFFQAQGWEPKLITEYYDDKNDAWRCEHVVGGGGRRDFAVS